MTVSVSPVKPPADAVTVTDPIATPVTCGCVLGVLAPWLIKTLGGTLSMVGSLLTSVTVTPPTGAGVDNWTGIAIDWPVGTTKPWGSAMPPSITTSTGAVLLV